MIFQEYAPLIAGSLLRVRLEFCVLESFVYESIIPFIKARGLSWVFPIKVGAVHSQNLLGQELSTGCWFLGLDLSYARQGSAHDSVPWKCSDGRPRFV